MARPARIEYEGAFYHVMNRGNQKDDIFLDDNDRQMFYEILGNVEKRYGIIIYVFILMSNHFLCEASHKTCYVQLIIM